VSKKLKMKFEKHLRSLGMKMSTTFPYLSNRGNRSSAVVPERNKIKR